MSLGCGERTVSGSQPIRTPRSANCRSSTTSTTWRAGPPWRSTGSSRSRSQEGWSWGPLAGSSNCTLRPVTRRTGTAYLISWLGILVPGDYISPVEIPWISAGGSLEAYAETLERLGDLLERATTVVPGHGAPIEAERARTILDEDVSYVAALARGATSALPLDRDTPAQQKIHAENLTRLG